jgi:hypothetical protein
MSSRIHITRQTAPAAVRGRCNCWLVYTCPGDSKEDILTMLRRNSPIYSHRNIISSTSTPDARRRTSHLPVACPGRFRIRQQGRGLHRRVEQPRESGRASAYSCARRRSQRTGVAADQTLERGRCICSSRPEWSRAVEVEAVKAKGAPKVGCAGSAQH